MQIGRAAIDGYHSDGTPVRTGAPISVANPSDRTAFEDSYLFTLTSEAWAHHYVLTYAPEAGEAVEVLAEWMLEHAPSYVTPLEDAEEECDICGASDGYECGCWIVTESGMIENMDRCLMLENPTKEHLIELHLITSRKDRWHGLKPATF